MHLHNPGPIWHFLAQKLADFGPLRASPMAAPAIVSDKQIERLSCLDSGSTLALGKKAGQGS